MEKTMKWDFTDCGFVADAAVVSSRLLGGSTLDGFADLVEIECILMILFQIQLIVTPYSCLLFFEA
jgi:hypothetical protein